MTIMLYRDEAYTLTYSPNIKSPDICICTLSQVSHANTIKISNQNHNHRQKKQVDKTTLTNNLMITKY